MSDANRLLIIEMLTTGEKCGCELLNELQVTQPTLSHHMKVLGECGLVSARKEGGRQHYSINYERFAVFKDYLNAVSYRKINSESGGENCCCEKGEKP